MVNDFKEALENGWRPTMEDGNDDYALDKEVQVTWLVQEGISLVKTSIGVISLTELDLKDAKEYNLRRAHEPRYQTR